jgi:hypothetical protein
MFDASEDKGRLQIAYVFLPKESAVKPEHEILNKNVSEQHIAGKHISSSLAHLALPIQHK